MEGETDGQKNMNENMQRLGTGPPPKNIPAAKCIQNDFSIGQ